MFILTTIVGCRPNYPLGTAALDSAQPPILHCLLTCPHALLVTVYLTTSSISQQTRQRTQRKFEHGWTKISTYLPTLTKKEIGMTFSALQPSPPWSPYSTSIVWRQAELHPQKQSQHFFQQRHSSYRCRSPRRTISLYSSSMQMSDECGRIRYAPFVVPLQRRTHTPPFRPKHLIQLIIPSLYTVYILTLDLLILSFNGFRLI